MAYFDWLATGQKTILERHQDLLAFNTYAYLINRTTALVTKPSPDLPTRDIVDWPENSRDGYVFTRVNTVVNSYAAQTTRMLAQLGVREMATTSESLVVAMNAALFSSTQGRYCDGVCADANHTSLHASMFPLAFKLVPPERMTSVVEWGASASTRRLSNHTRPIQKEQFDFPFSIPFWVLLGTHPGIHRNIYVTPTLLLDACSPSQ